MVATVQRGAGARAWNYYKSIFTSVNFPVLTVLWKLMVLKKQNMGGRGVDRRRPP